jgi:hypothetical protein
MDQSKSHQHGLQIIKHPTYSIGIDVIDGSKFNLTFSVLGNGVFASLEGNWPINSGVSPKKPPKKRRPSIYIFYPLDQLTSASTTNPSTPIEGS